MNPYFASRMVDERLADDRLAIDALADGRPSNRHVDPGAWSLRSGPAGVDRSRRADIVPGSAGSSGLGAPRHGRRVRRVAGWLLIEAGLRLAVGRTAAVRG